MSQYQWQYAALPEEPTIQNKAKLCISPIGWLLFSENAALTHGKYCHIVIYSWFRIFTTGSVVLGLHILRASEGSPAAMLPVLHYVLLGFSRHVASFVIQRGYEARPCNIYMNFQGIKSRIRVDCPTWCWLLCKPDARLHACHRHFTRDSGNLGCW